MKEEEIKEIAKTMFEDAQAKHALLQKLKDEDLVIDELDTHSADMTVALLYLGKLIEGKFIAMDSAPSFTSKGFDLAMDLVDAGWMLSKLEAMAVCAIIFETMEEQAHIDISILMIEMQDRGIDGMNKLMNEMEELEKNKDS